MTKKKQGIVNHALNAIMDLLLVYGVLALYPYGILEGMWRLSWILYDIILFLLLVLGRFYHPDCKDSLLRRISKLVITCLAAVVCLAVLRRVGNRGTSSVQAYAILFASSAAVLGIKYTLMQRYTQPGGATKGELLRSGVPAPQTWGDRLISALMVAQSLYYLTYGMFPLPKWEPMTSAIIAAVLLLACILWFIPRLIRWKSASRIGAWLLLANALWVLLTRIVLAAPFHEAVMSAMWSALYFCCFSCAALTDAQQRRRLCSAFTALSCGILLLWGIIGVYAAWTGKAVQNDYFLREGICLSMDYPAQPLIYVKFLNTHRNGTAFYYVIGTGLLLYQQKRNPTTAWRLSAAICLPVFIVVLALQHSRSCWVAAGVCIAMDLGAKVSDLLRQKAAVLRNGAALLLAGIGAVLIFVSFNPLSSSFIKCSEFVHSRMEAIQTSQSTDDAPAEQTEPAEAPVEQTEPAEAPAEQTEPPEAPEETLTLSEDTRDTLQDAKTLTSRTRIWTSVLPALEEQPSIALVGQREGGMMDIINQFAGFRANHMHNMLLQQLMLFGIPSFLFCTVFLIWVSLRILRCYFGEYTAAQKYMAAVCSAAILYGLVEAMLSRFIPYSSMAFILLCGCFMEDTGSD